MYILALDQGTTSSRAILFDRAGNPVRVAQQEFEQHFPRPGWVEHDAEEIWETQLKVAREVLTDLAAGELAAIGITNQRETTVIWDRKTGKPVHNAIVWQDRRTAGMCDDLERRGLEAFFRERTGLVLDAYFSGTKVAWILDNVDGVRPRAAAGELAFGTIDSWLIYNLTGGRTHVTDASNASRTLLYNIHSGMWDSDLIDLLEIPESLLPGVVASSGTCAHTTGDLFGAEFPISGVAGDQQAALFGQNCLKPGMVKNTYGTGCFLLMNTGKKAIQSTSGLLTTIAWQLDGQTTYALEGSVFIGGAVVQWLRDGLGLLERSSDVEALARTVPDNGGVYFVPAFVGLGAPHWDPYARGAIFGLTRGSTRGHLARAALESIAYQTADLLGAMVSDSGLDLDEIRVDGGAAGNNLLMQFQADLLGVSVVRPTITESTARGAAFLAGLAVGFWNDVDEIAAIWKEDRRFERDVSEDEVKGLMANWRKAVSRAGGWEERK